MHLRGAQLAPRPGDDTAFVLPRFAASHRERQASGLCSPELELAAGGKMRPSPSVCVARMHPIA